MPYSSMRHAAAVVLALVGALIVTGPATAATDVSGRWDSDSLRDNGIGYYLNLTPVPGDANSYRGTLMFRYQDGRRGDTVRLRATTNGEAMLLVPLSGSFDRSAGNVRAEVNDTGDVITFVNCRARLRLVMVNDLESDCTFRPAN